MGYVRQRKTYRLIFEDEEFAGLEVVARSASVDTYQRIAGLATREYSSPPSTEDLAEVDALYQAFAKVLVSWNLEEEVEQEDGTLSRAPVPATYHGLCSQDLPFAQAIVTAWMDAVAGVSGPLPQPSTGGATFLEASLPMEALSPSR